MLKVTQYGLLSRAKMKLSFWLTCRSCSGTSRNTAQEWRRCWTCVKSSSTTATPAPQRRSVTPSSRPPEGWTGAGGTSVPCRWRGGSSQCLFDQFSSAFIFMHRGHRLCGLRVLKVAKYMRIYQHALGTNRIPLPSMAYYNIVDYTTTNHTIMRSRHLKLHNWTSLSAQDWGDVEVVAEVSGRLLQIRRLAEDLRKNGSPAELLWSSVYCR